ncbi:hypothetical protein ABN284_22410, partial [Escherichia coli]|nr:hypothetical protein [Escherichia coli]
MVTATHLRPSRQKCVVARITGTLPVVVIEVYVYEKILQAISGNDSNLLIVFYVQIMPDDFVMQLHR